LNEAKYKRKKAGRGNIFADIATVLAMLFFLFPIFYVISTAIKPKLLAFTSPPVWFVKPTFENFMLVFQKQGFTENFFNSLIVALSSTILAIVIGAPSAYAFSRYNFKGKSNLLFWILSTRMAPPIAAVIPFFMIVRGLGLYDTQISLIAIYLAFNLPLSIWMMKSFFDGTPREFEEAAMVDGCTPINAFIRVVIPISLPGLATTAVFCFLFSWNEFLMAMVLTGRVAKTLPVLITGYIQQTSGILWAEMSAASIILIIPTVFFTLFAQRYLLRGLTFGALKE
jgi:multiple sugar transport system permease protein